MILQNKPKILSLFSISKLDKRASLVGRCPCFSVSFGAFLRIFSSEFLIDESTLTLAVPAHLDDITFHMLLSWEHGWHPWITKLGNPKEEEKG